MPDYFWLFISGILLMTGCRPVETAEPEPSAVRKTPEDFSYDFETTLHYEHRQKLQTKLSTLIKTPPPEEMNVLWFSIESDWSTFPVQVAAMDPKAEKVTYSKPPFCCMLLEDSGLLIPEGLMDWDAYKDAGIDTHKLGTRILAEFFGQYWQDSGGSNFPLPAYISAPESDQAYDLKTRKWIDKKTLFQ